MRIKNPLLSNFNIHPVKRRNNNPLNTTVNKLQISPLVILILEET